jgi:hypothetical protein
VVVGLTAAAAQGQPTGPAPIQPSDPYVLPVNGKYDYWVTPEGLSMSQVDIPADFFGRGSDAWSGVIGLTGDPFGPGAGAHKPEDADTTMRRNRDPRTRNIGATDTVTLRIHALSLRSESPITVSYNGGAYTELWDVHVSLSDAAPQPAGTLTATKTHANGGTFDSTFSVIPKFRFTRVGDGAEETLDTGDPTYGLPPSGMSTTGVPWVDNLSGTPSGGFNPGYSAPPGCTSAACINPALLYYLLFVLNNCAQHTAGPCTTCPPAGGGGPIIIWEDEAQSIDDDIVIIDIGHPDSDDDESPVISTRPGRPVGP